MPSKRENGKTVTTALYDVIAEDGESPNFIRHTGLASKSGEQNRTTVTVSEMGPPMRLAGSMKADAIGIADLEDGEARKIKDFVDRHAGEHEAVLKLRRSEVIDQAYCILPHKIRYNFGDKRYARMRFSCAGFVFEAYKRARIRLIEHDKLPPVTLDQIKLAYPEVSPWLDDPEFRDRLGLAGDGPWPVMFCGYLINALNRTKSEIRGAPVAVEIGDEIFPR